MNEYMMEKYVIRQLRKAEFFVMKMDLSSAPGVPDLLISKNNVTVLTELKYHENVNVNLRRLFQKTQPTFYIEYLKFNSLLYVLLFDDKEYHFFNINNALLNKMVFENETIKLKDLSKYCNLYDKRKDLRSIIELYEIITGGY